MVLCPTVKKGWVRTKALTDGSRKLLRGGAGRARRVRAVGLTPVTGASLLLRRVASIIRLVHLKWCTSKGAIGLDRGLDRRMDACRAFYAAR